MRSCNKQKIAEIVPLPGSDWEPKACLMEFLRDSDNIESIFILCRTKDGESYNGAAGHTNASLMWALQNHIYRMMRDNNDL